VFTGLTVGKTLFQALMAEAQKNELQQFRQEITHVASCGWMDDFYNLNQSWWV